MNLHMMGPKVKEALFGVESIHHIHGQECLCGFKSAVSRERTKHIMEVTFEVLSTKLAELSGQLDAADRQISARSGTTAAERIWQGRAEAAEAALQRVTREVDHWLDGGEEDKWHADQIVMALNRTALDDLA